MLLMVAPLSLLAQKVAHYNSQEIVTNYSEFKKVQTEVEAIGKQYQADLEAMQKELQSKFEKYQAEVNDKTPANIRARKEIFNNASNKLLKTTNKLSVKSNKSACNLSSTR